MMHAFTRLCVNERKRKLIYLLLFYFYYSLRYIRSERSIILLNFCLSIVCSNILILVGQTQTHNVVSVLDFFFSSLFCILFKKCGGCVFFLYWRHLCSGRFKHHLTAASLNTSQSSLFFVLATVSVSWISRGFCVAPKKKKIHGCRNLLFFWLNLNE